MIQFMTTYIHIYIYTAHMYIYIYTSTYPWYIHEKKLHFHTAGRILSFRGTLSSASWRWPLFLFIGTGRQPWIIGGFPEIGDPPIIHLSGIFAYEPSIWRYPHFWKPPYIYNHNNNNHHHNNKKYNHQYIAYQLLNKNNVTNVMSTPEKIKA